MKFMLNGAVTLGTEDGANVEIHQFVGDDNIFIFGESSDDVIEHYAKSDYSSEAIYDADPEIAKLVDFIISKEMFAVGNKKSLIRLYMEIVTKDWFMTLLDTKSYIEEKEKMLAAYEDRERWEKMMLKNIANAGFFSSDRTIAQYNEDIWHL
jgi:starch phosphorylase